MEIKNSVAIVSGGASGMGEATVRRLAASGAKVAVFDTNMERAEKIALETGSMAIGCDVTQAKNIEDAVAKVKDTLGPIRICVNCAGIVKSKRMVGKEGAMPLDEFRQVIEVNLVGTFNLMRVAAAAIIFAPPQGESQERGVIINTASVAAFEGQIGQTAYSASKGGIISMTLPAARELAQFGIRVLAIAPGLIDTPMFEKIPTEAREALAAMVPFPKRLGHPDEYARLVLHIIENEMLNGEVIRLDGALRMREK